MIEFASLELMRSSNKMLLSKLPVLWWAWRCWCYCRQLYRSFFHFFNTAG